MIQIYTQIETGQQWLEQYRGKSSVFACILGFTATGLIPGISAAGATPHDRKYTAIADAEFLINGVASNPQYPLPPLEMGASPVFISRAVVEALNIPVYLFNAGLPIPPGVSAIDLGGTAANCLTSGRALPLEIVRNLFARGFDWGDKLAKKITPGYLIVGECVVGGTTTALALLTGLGIKAKDKVNSSHPSCNHRQKWTAVRKGLARAGFFPLSGSIEPLKLVAAVGDPMQIVAAGMAIAASRRTGVMLAGGTQMLAVLALMRSISDFFGEKARWERIVVATTRWVAEDPTGDTVELAKAVGGATLLATKLSFAASSYPQLRAYEQGYVKEGVGAGGCASAASLQSGWNQSKLLAVIESQLQRYEQECDRLSY